ncbi:unnamed protein product, partial [Trichobilharzia regenti]
MGAKLIFSILVIHSLIRSDAVFGIREEAGVFSPYMRKLNNSLWLQFPMTFHEGSLLVGREKEQKFLLSLLNKKNPLSTCLVISGPPGCGKSSLISSTFKVLEESYGMLWVLVSCLESFVGTQGVCGSTPSRYLLELILQSIKCRYLPTSDVCVRCDDTSSFVDNLCHILLTIAAERNNGPTEKLCDGESLVLPLIVGLGSIINWRAFDEPVTKGLVAPDDEWGQWKLAQPFLKRSLATLYLRHYADASVDSVSPKNATRQDFLELPYITRFLLIAAFIASYNPRSSDKKLLSKASERLSVRKKKQEKEALKFDCQGSQLLRLSDPNFVHLSAVKRTNRLMAIFYALVQNEFKKVPCTSILMSQIASLTACGLLSPSSQALSVGNSYTVGLGTVGGSINSASDLDPLGNPKYRCLISLEMAK